MDSALLVSSIQLSETYNQFKSTIRSMNQPIKDSNDSYKIDNLLNGLNQIKRDMSQILDRLRHIDIVLYQLQFDNDESELSKQVKGATNDMKNRMLVMYNYLNTFIQGIIEKESGVNMNP